MSDSTPSAPPPPPEGYRPPPPAGSPSSYGAQPPSPYGGYGAPATYGAPGGAPLGKVRGTGVCIVLAIVTFGIYSLYWYFKTHEEMKQHSGQGVGGGVGLILALFVGFVMPYLTASEVGGLYKRRGQEPPVSGLTGLWYFPGMFILVGPIVWFVKTNGALNRYWESLGATRD